MPARSSGIVGASGGGGERAVGMGNGAGVPEYPQMRVGIGEAGKVLEVCVLDQASLGLRFHKFPMKEVKAISSSPSIHPSFHLLSARPSRWMS